MKWLRSVGGLVDVRLSRVNAAEVCVIKEEAVEGFLPRKATNSSLAGDRTHVEKSSE